MSSAEAKTSRPLSPHIQIYHWYVTMVMSIAHRITGGALYFGALLLAWWLVALAAGPHAFGFANRVIGSWFGILVMIGFSWALIHHALGGIRHFVWDFGYALDKTGRDTISLLNLIGSLALTAILWVAIYFFR
jgi:succinate dehydrogenase / fumarate reductase cytochrome b subunit